MRRASIIAAAAGAAAIAIPIPIAGHAAVAPAALPRPDHVVILIDENHSYNQINGRATAPYLNSLGNTGAKFTMSFGMAHPSEPNYLALFSGSTQGLSDDSCPHTYSGANLGSELIAAGLSFTGYSETMPSDGYTGCTSG
ncbi:MAG: acid phosphatase, partial [Micromonosporaceae bacterium]|nr:acid phosphatase [Micromonosporaceae bacterium]